MKLTKAEVLNFEASAYKDTLTLQDAIRKAYGCGISPETALRIIADWKALRSAGS
jgi:hypothetical protein